MQLFRPQNRKHSHARASNAGDLWLVAGISRFPDVYAYAIYSTNMPLCYCVLMRSFARLLSRLLGHSVRVLCIIIHTHCGGVGVVLYKRRMFSVVVL